MPAIDILDENKMMNNISNQLMIDIMSGDGPDIILDGAAIQELNNPEYFVDLINLLMAIMASISLNTSRR